jgi:hypothetical protein
MGNGLPNREWHKQKKKRARGRAGSHGRSVTDGGKAAGPGADVGQSRGPDRGRAVLSLSSGVSGEAKAELMARTHDHIEMYKRMGMANVLCECPLRMSFTESLSMNTPINPLRTG